MGLLFVPIWTQTISKVNKADPPGASKLSSFRKCWNGWRHQGGQIYFGRLLKNFGRLLNNFGRLLNNFGRLLKNFGRLLTNFGRLLNNFGRLLNNFGGE